MNGAIVKRDETFDVLRGVCVVLVVLWHAWLLVDKGTVISFTADVIDEFMSVSASLRMPALMLTAGYFSIIILHRKSARDFLAGKLSKVVYPAVVWSLLMAGLFAFNPGEAAPARRFLWEVIQPSSHPWFLQYLSLFFACTILIWRSRLTCILLAVACLLALLIAEESRLLYLAHFYTVGLCTPRTMLERLSKLGRAPLALSAIFLAIPAIIISGTAEEGKYSAQLLPVSYLILPSTFAGCAYMSQYARSAIPAFRRVSGSSLEIYLLHWPIMLIASFIIKSFDTGIHFGTQFLLNILAGFGGSIAALAVFQSMGISWLFRAPAWLSSFWEHADERKKTPSTAA